MKAKLHNEIASFKSVNELVDSYFSLCEKKSIHFLVIPLLDNKYLLLYNKIIEVDLFKYNEYNQIIVIFYILNILFSLNIFFTFKKKLYILIINIIYLLKYIFIKNF